MRCRSLLARLGLFALLATPAAAQTNTVSIGPATRTVTGIAPVTVTVTWCGYPGTPQNYMDINSRVIKVNGVDVTTDFDLQTNPTACGFSGPVADEVLYTSTGFVYVTPSTGPVTVSADVSNSYNYHWQASTTYYPLAARRGVTVIANAQYVTPSPGSVRSERFTITNTGNAADTFALSPAIECSGSAIMSSCVVSPVSLPLAAGANGFATVSYTTGTTATTRGLIRLRAVNTDGTTRDSSWVDVTVGATPVAGVELIGTAPGRVDNLARDACVTIALTDASASECGDLRLVHALPSVRTMGTTRTPMLLYNSQHARPKPLVVADVRLSSSVALPASVTACITIGVRTPACTTYPGSSWGTPGEARRIVVAAGDSAWVTGPIKFGLAITTSDGAQGPYNTNGRFLIVNRSASTFGAGWWLAGLEQLQVFSATELYWTGGDGSARRYVQSGSVWRVANFASLDSIERTTTGYVRKTAEQARVYFNATGQHDSTVNSAGHLTSFAYTGSLLTRIQFPTISGVSEDSLFYVNGLLDSVNTPNGRGMKLFRTAARVDSIRDPDGGIVRFGAGTGLNQNVVTARTDRRGNTTNFTYDVANRVAQATRPLGNTITLIAAESRGLSTPIMIDSAFTEMDGPRSDVSDVTRFWINGYGAPVRTRNAVGQESFVHFNPTWPGLADSTMSPNRLSATITYNARALPIVSRIVQPYGTGGDAVTSYQWHPAMNRTTSVRTLTAGSATLLDSMSYNADSTLAWTQRGSSSGTRVNYTYTAMRLPATLVLPGIETTTFGYSALGNLRKEQSPLNYLTLLFEDAAGRDTLVITPVLDLDLETYMPRAPARFDLEAR